MDRIDHYPGCEQPNDEQEGKAAGQIAALRDQQETFYYRNDAVYRTQEIIQNKKQSDDSPNAEKELSIYEQSRTVATYGQQLDPTSSTASAVGCFFGLFVGIIIFSFAIAIL